MFNMYDFSTYSSQSDINMKVVLRECSIFVTLEERIKNVLVNIYVHL